MTFGMDSKPLKEYASHLQARLVVFRLGEAQKRLLTYDKADETELSWLIETADSILTLCLAHAKECERLWTPKAPTPSTAGAEGERGLKQEGGVQD